MPSIGEDLELLGHSYNCQQGCRMVRPLWEAVWQFPKKLDIPGTQVAQSVKSPTLDLRVVSSSPKLGVEPP